MKFSRAMLTGALITTIGLWACGDDDETGPITPPNEAPTIQVTAPDGGETFDPGSMVSITWTADDDAAVSGVDLSYKADGMASYEAITTDETGTSFDWTVPNENLFGVKVRATAKDAEGATAEDESDGVFAIVPVSPRGYVTSSVCANCHQQKWDQVRDSGHPYKINKVENGQPPTYPHSDVPQPPDGFAWGDISYVIGGYGWKARFMDLEGYVITTGVDGVDAQYNIPRDDLGDGGLPAEWTTYHPTQSTAQEYTCGTCHTTGWQTFAENGGVHQDGLVGILGTWEEPGINCEQCHGPGGDHVATKYASEINIDSNSELCGSCHFRDTNHRILVSRPFIRHHEQYDEMISAGHVNLSCTTCHDPHIGVRYGNADAGGIRADCSSCHQSVDVDHLVPLDCEDCHMPRAGKSARAVQSYQGDVRTHIFKINSDPVRREDAVGMFFEDEGSTFSRGFVTLDFVCYQCHTDPVSQEGGGGSELSMGDLSDRAKIIHQ